MLRQSTPDLSIVLPTRNAAPFLGATFERIAEIKSLETQVVFVDDYSTDSTRSLLGALVAQNSNVEVVHHQRQQGAGVARNSGFARAIGRYTLFFDVDDFLHTDVVRPLVEALDRTGADVALTGYRFGKDWDAPTRPPHKGDEQILRSCLRGSSEQIVRLGEHVKLLEFTNYPWNKVVRTARFRDVGLKYGSTLVHNDVLGHWQTLINAREILVSDTELCTHIVPRGAANLTNRNNRSRLLLVTAFAELLDYLDHERDLRSIYGIPYWTLMLKTARWAWDRLDSDLRPEFQRQLRPLLQRMSISEVSGLRMTRSSSHLNFAVDRMMR